ncbi:MAG: hypothetical protein ABIY62_09130 [Ginsengibacter sp.]
MRSNLFVLIFISFTTLSYGQTVRKIEAIRKKVEAINSDTNYSIKKLNNDYFVDVKNEVADGGQELTGYYKKKQIKKIIYTVGISYVMTTYKYYFSDNKLLFVFEKQDTYAQIKDSLGHSTGFNYSKLEFAFEGRYYFDKFKLFETKKIGKEWFANGKNDNKEDEFLTDSKSFVEELRNAKKN